MPLRWPRKPAISVGVIDLRTILPYDFETIAEAVKRTSRVIVAHEDQLTCGFGAEIAARISEDLFEYLDAPVTRVGAMDTPVAYAPELEAVILPQTEDLLKAIEKVTAYSAFRSVRVPVVQQRNRTFSCLADFVDVRAPRIVGSHLVQHEIAVPDDDPHHVLHVVHELAIGVQSVNLSSMSQPLWTRVDYVRSTAPPGGGSLTTAQNAPSWRTASMNDGKSTGFTTYALAPSL